MTTCQGITQKGNQCKIICKTSDFCHIHNENCSICLENFKSKIKLNCSHKFCKLCIYNWMFTSFNCPLCRTVISDREKFIEYAYKFKFYLNMKKYDIVISHLDKIDLDILNLWGVYINRYITKIEWEKIKINTLYLNINTNVLAKTFIAKIKPERYDDLKKNNELYFFY